MNYRTPAQIAEAAVRMANAAGLVVSAPKAVREGRFPPILDTVHDAVAALAQAMPEELTAIDGGLLAVSGKRRRAVLRTKVGLGAALSADRDGHSRIEAVEVHRSPVVLSARPAHRPPFADRWGRGP